LRSSFAGTPSTCATTHRGRSALGHSLTSPATTVALLKLNAVVGLKGSAETVNGKDTLTGNGTTCALCHSTVDNSFAPGIGARLDGWPNSELNPGAIIALSAALSAEQKGVYNSCGPGKYDPRFNFDGLNGPQVIPPAYGVLGSTGSPSPVLQRASTGDQCEQPARSHFHKARGKDSILRRNRKRIWLST
jgi:hypothetical protein